jgi:poly-gamma-glutamate capsule biosynthesis protein CapA/YwtB (metallophosphatase superfamily)
LRTDAEPTSTASYRGPEPNPDPAFILVPRIAKLALVLAVLTAVLAAALNLLPAGPGEASAGKPRSVASGNPVILAFGGDVHFEGALESMLAADPAGLLAPIEPVLDDADLAVVNLETAITTGGSPVAKQFTFSAHPAAFTALREGGVDLASMANNHGLDYGEAGLRDSLAAATRHRFPVIGIGLDGKQAYRPFRRTIKGRKIAVLGATQVIDDELISAWTAGPNKPGLASAKEVPRLLQEVRRARKTSDTVVVFLHWGVELEQCPTRDQRTLARQLVAAGADIVVGGHSHRLLGVGRMDKALVGYGLGNFVWYGTSKLSTRTGVLFVTVDGRNVLGYRWVPAHIVDGVPRPLTGSARRSELASWRALRRCTDLKR